jgi:hypothetical protein
MYGETASVVKGAVRRRMSGRWPGISAGEPPFDSAHDSRITHTHLESPKLREGPGLRSNTEESLGFFGESALSEFRNCRCQGPFNPATVWDWLCLAKRAMYVRPHGRRAVDEPYACQRAASEAPSALTDPPLITPEVARCSFARPIERRFWRCVEAIRLCI